MKFQKSEAYNDNLLIRDKNIYLMDNHRLAMWSWLQEIDFSKRYNFIHVDAHPDLAIFPVEKKMNQVRQDISLDDFRNLTDLEFNVPVIRWDNYIDAFNVHFKNVIDENFSYTCTHYQGSRKSLKNELFTNQLPSFLKEVFTEKIFINDQQWIVNIDLDFFFSKSPEKILMFTDEYFESLFSSIKLGIDNGLIQVCTIALSPECSGGWENSFKALRKAQKYLKVDFLSLLDK